jgi:hypothetical protein
LTQTSKAYWIVLGAKQYLTLKIDSTLEVKRISLSLQSGFLGLGTDEGFALTPWLCLHWRCLMTKMTLKMSIEEHTLDTNAGNQIS